MSGVTVLLLRGINVGGRNRLPMADLRAMVQALGCEAPRTYIQSGNLVCRGAPNLAALAAAIETTHDVRPHLLSLPLEEYEAILDTNPFTRQAAEHGAAVHLYLADAPLPPLPAAVQAVATRGEEVAVRGRAAWLLAPDGIGRSKLAARLERAFGLPVTARNWKTAVAIRDLGRSLQ